jgi:hypothetical protein
MAPPIETEQPQAEAAQLAKRTIQIHPLVKWGQINRRKNNSPLRNRLDERTYIQRVVTILGLDRLGRYELTHVKALVFSICRNQGIQEEVLIELLREELKIGKVEHIRHDDYARVVDFLGGIIVSDDALSGRQ